MAADRVWLCVRHVGRDDDRHDDAVGRANDFDLRARRAPGGGAGQALRLKQLVPGGYLLAWTTFSLVATSAQWALERAALLTPMMESASNRLGAAVLIRAGVYQWAPLKEACLSHCRSPLLFIQQHGGFRSEPYPALALGFRHGIYCIGCCWALMALLFVGGVMNLFWIAVLAILVLLEKIAPLGRLAARIAGICLIASGAWLLAKSL
jgi:predicted metal-binding membrane protein